MTDFPVLRVRATDPLNVQEISIDGVDLIPLGATSLSLRITGRRPPVVALEFAVVLDFELPAEVEAWVRKHDGKGISLSRVEPSTTEADS